MAYNPNFNDSRVLASAKKALNFVELYIKTDEVRPISSTQLYKHFGNTSRPLSRWLVEQLLIVRDPYYNMNTGVCKKYSKNPTGIKTVKELAGLANFVPELPKELVTQLETGNFEYNTINNRHYNPIQYLPKRERSKTLAEHGFRYSYDLEAAAPTLLLQRAKELNPNLQVPALEQYVNDRSLMRKKLAYDCATTQDKVKTAITALLQGGVLSTWPNNKTFVALSFDYDTVKRLNNHDFVIQLKSDIRDLWKSLRGEFSVRYITNKNGKQVRQKLTGKEKSGYYRELEDQVGTVIKKLLKKKKIDCMWIHDGWYCNRVIDPNDVVLEVKRKTGFLIKLDWTIYEDN